MKLLYELNEKNLNFLIEYNNDTVLWKRSNVCIYNDLNFCVIQT